MTTGEPARIPARVALRACADALFAEAARLLDRQHGGGRRGVTAPVPGREAVAARRRAEATELIRLSRLPEASTWPGVDAAQLGYLVAWLHGWDAGLVELRAELEEEGRGGLLPPKPHTVETCRLVCGVPDLEE